MAGTQVSMDLSSPEAQQEAIDLAEKAVQDYENRPDKGMPDDQAAAPVEEAAAEAPAEEASAPEAGDPKVAEQAKAAGEAGDIPEEIASQLDINAFSVEYAENGALSDESRASIKAVLEPAFGEASDFVINSYLSGLDAQNAQVETTAQNAAGGEESYKASLEWAADNLSDEEVEAYNAAVLNPKLTAIVAQGLHAKYLAASGTSPEADNSRVSPPAVTSAGTITINSQQQLAKLVSDPEYINDPGHRARVDAQIEAARKRGAI